MWPSILTLSVSTWMSLLTPLADMQPLANGCATGAAAGVVVSTVPILIVTWGGGVAVTPLSVPQSAMLGCATGMTVAVLGSHVSETAGRLLMYFRPTVAPLGRQP